MINASPSLVWYTLTDVALMKQWMGEEEMQLEIITDWSAGNSVIIKGFHHAKFENRGIVLQFEPYKTLRYSHLNSLSRLSDKEENYAVIEFLLKPMENQTELTLNLSRFPTETIMKHLDFYWNTTLQILKQKVEFMNNSQVK